MSQEIVRLLERLNERLDGIETRLSQIESSKVILDEKKIIAREKELEGKTYFQTGDGGVVKEIRIPVCDVCGRGSEKYNVCISCGRKLCEACSILFQNRVHCLDCLNERLPLTKQEYKLLTAIANGVRLDEFVDLAKMKKDEIKAFEKSLVEKQLIEKKGFLLFYETAILDRGLEAISAYRQVYGNEEDVIIFEEELREFLNEKS